MLMTKHSGVYCSNYPHPSRRSYCSDFPFIVSFVIIRRDRRLPLSETIRIYGWSAFELPPFAQLCLVATTTFGESGREGGRAKRKGGHNGGGNKGQEERGGVILHLTGMMPLLETLFCCALAYICIFLSQKCVSDC